MQEAHHHHSAPHPHARRAQAQHRRILQLEAEAEALRVDAGRQAEALGHQRAQTRAAEATIQELQSELENNAGGCAPGAACRLGAVPLPLMPRCRPALPSCRPAHTVVFDMHYNELLLKNEEIERLKTVIEGLGSAG
jgi:hypothetical protein